MIRRLALVGALVLTAGAAGAAAEVNSGAPDAHFGLGPLRTFGQEFEARTACGEDPVVWAERYAGFFYMPEEDRYATAPWGAYACKSDARLAHYWGTSLFDSLAEYKGKEMRWEYPAGY